MELTNAAVNQIFLETPRARVTLLLSHYHESLANPLSPTPGSKDAMQTACDLLTDLQVETYSSMERREKTEFILEQMRLLIAVARQKDAAMGKDGKDSIGGGEAEWVKVRVGGRKINEEFLKEKDNEVYILNSCVWPFYSSFLLGSQTQVLRPHDPTCAEPECLPRRGQILLQSLGNALNQRG